MRTSKQIITEKCKEKLCHGLREFFFVFCMYAVVCPKISFCLGSCRIKTSGLICNANGLPGFCMQWFPVEKYCQANFSISVIAYFT